jgi:hypothetical protein
VYVLRRVELGLRRIVRALPDDNGPLTEAGDFTDKFVKVQDVISKYLKVRRISVSESVKEAFGPLKFTSLFRCLRGQRSSRNLTVRMDMFIFDHGVLSQNRGHIVAKSFRPKTFVGTVKAGDHVAVPVEHLTASTSEEAWRVTIRGPGRSPSAVKKWRQSLIPLESFTYNVKWDPKLVIGMHAFY